jgi:hypothetical protein
LLVCTSINGTRKRGSLTGRRQRMGTRLSRQSNRSPLAPPIPARKRFRRGRDRAAILGPPSPIPRDRDWDLSRLVRQSPGKLKTIPPAPGNRSCAGLRGGGRTPPRPVSKPKFPANREINREFRCFSAFSANRAIGEPAESTVWRQDSLRRRAGNFLAGAGNSSGASGNFLASAGSGDGRDRGPVSENSRTSRKNGNFALILP